MRVLLRRVLWSVPIVITVSDVVASVIRVDGASMRPTLNPNGGGGTSDWVLVEKWSIKVRHTPQRGDVIVLWAPDAPHQQIVKRLVALQGDSVSVETPGGRATTTTVPEGRCWVEGDNAPESLDSRSAYGPVHLGLLEGRVTHIIWPPSRFGAVQTRSMSERLLYCADNERDNML